MGEAFLKMVSAEQIYNSVKPSVSHQGLNYMNERLAKPSLWHQGLNYMKERLAQKRIQSSPANPAPGASAAVDSGLAQQAKRARLG